MRCHKVLILLGAAFTLTMITPSSQAQWIEGGISVCAEDYNQWAAEMISDGEGGTFVLWEDQRADGESYDVMMNLASEP